MSKALPAPKRYKKKHRSTEPVYNLHEAIYLVEQYLDGDLGSGDAAHLRIVVEAAKKEWRRRGSKLT